MPAWWTTSGLKQHAQESKEMPASRDGMASKLQLSINKVAVGSYQSALIHT